MGSEIKSKDEVPTYYSNLVEFLSSDSDTCFVFNLNIPKRDEEKIAVSAEPQVRVYISNNHLEKFIEKLIEHKENMKETK